MTGTFDLDPLESRTLCSATLSVRGILYVVGTPHSDLITLEIDRRHRSVLDVTINGRVSSFRVASVKQVIVEGGRGADKVIFNNRYGKIPGHRKIEHQTVTDYYVTDDGSGFVEVEDDGDIIPCPDPIDDTPPADSTPPSTQPTTQPTDPSDPSDPSSDDPTSDS